MAIPSEKPKHRKSCSAKYILPGISPFLRTLSEKDVGLFLASLCHPQSNTVGKDLLYSGPLPSISKLGKQYLQKTLLGYLTSEVDDLLPLSSLPESPLNALLDLKSELLNLSLDFLGFTIFASRSSRSLKKIN